MIPYPWPFEPDIVTLVILEEALSITNAAEKLYASTFSIVKNRTSESDAPVTTPVIGGPVVLYTKPVIFFQGLPDYFVQIYRVVWIGKLNKFLCVNERDK